MAIKPPQLCTCFHVPEPRSVIESPGHQVMAILRERDRGNMILPHLRYQANAFLRCRHNVCQYYKQNIASQPQ
jgi:hypothetical protein